MPENATLEAPPPAPLRPPNTASALEEITERADTVWTRDAGKPPKVEVSGRRELKGAHGRIAIVDGCRTPFIKSGTDFQSLDVIDLASIAAAELVARLAIDPEEIDLSVFGVVVPALHAPNLGREVVFRTSLPMSIPGVTVNLACASSTRAITFGAEAILTGEAGVEDGEGDRRPAPRPGRDRPPLPPPRRRRYRGRPAEGPDRPGLPAARLRQGRDPRQRHPRRLLAGGAGQAEAGLRQALWQPDGGQLEPADRRRLGRDPDERGEGQG